MVKRIATGTLQRETLKMLALYFFFGGAQHLNIQNIQLNKYVYTRTLQ